ncbi:DUF1684 domain-containing protein [Mucilaginibacter terrenus]|uniref:DUF1684 domain-containing protein n=1 Tax=Mucilaginibacter terrenus TaxID=2482727 RepID=A0A3E2NR52_9SPHI|nr:DUF1684 domain-containing protein [Mucilaginibacter terrenus]RFZ83466.1 DUF1684 domain-containing protein [Mucilaginibacter terrenus]
MKNLLFIFFAMLCINGFAQDHKTQIEEFRNKYKADFLSDARSPLKKEDLALLRFYDADSTYRVTAQVEVLNNEALFMMPVFSGTQSEYVRYATLKFTLKGKPLQLTLYKSTALAKIPQYANYLFLPFTDDTNGAETYDGGRYIDLSTQDIKNNMLVLDFNKAYNPYCAFSSGYSCPKPPDENKLPLKIEAGEQKFAGGKKH